MAPRRRLGPGTRCCPCWAAHIASLRRHWPAVGCGPAIAGCAAGVVSRIVDATCQQLDEAAIDTAHLVGNSLGGWVALELARRGRARSVLALSPAGAWRSPRDLRRLLALFRAGATLARVNDMPSLAARKRVRRILLLPVAEHADRMTPEQVAATLKDIAGCTALPEILDGARDNGPMRPIHDVGCRVRIAWGLNDRMLPFMRYGAPMLAAVPAAEFEFLPRRRTRADDRRCGLGRQHDSRACRENRSTADVPVRRHKSANRGDVSPDDLLHDLGGAAINGLHACVDERSGDTGIRDM